MTVLSANLESLRKSGEIVSYPVVGTDIVYKGGLVNVNAAGYAKPGSDTSGEIFGGVAVEKVDNSSGAAGAKNVRVYRTGTFEFAKTTAVQGDVGSVAYVEDDQTVVVTGSTASIIAGTIVELIDSSTVRVDIGDRVA